MAEKQSKPTHAALISTMVEYGNSGKNLRLTGHSKEERKQQFREIYYGRKSQSERNAQ